ncbi:MAG: flagellar basal body-associated FliL family protein [bacterium]|nr:flagellar basal body-associated FliL family protein [bacterium]
MGDEERDDLMDEEEEEAGDIEEAGGSTEPNKIVRILLFVAGGVLLIVLVTGISFLVSKKVQETGYERSQDIVAAPPPRPLSVYDIPALSKTTADEEPHFLKLHISLAYEQNMQLSTELGNRKDEILHVINVLLQGKKYEDLDSVDDTVSLVEEIKAHINKRLIDGKIKDIYIKEFVVN